MASTVQKIRGQRREDGAAHDLGKESGFVERRLQELVLSAEFQCTVAEVVRKSGYAETGTLGSLSPTHAAILNSFVCQPEAELCPNFPAKALILLK